MKNSWPYCRDLFVIGKVLENGSIWIPFKFIDMHFKRNESSGQSGKNIIFVEVTFIFLQIEIGVKVEDVSASIINEAVFLCNQMKRVSSLFHKK